MTAEVLHLVTKAVSQETVEMFRYWLAEAEAGRVRGAVVGAIHNSIDYTVDAAGDCSQYRGLARGMIADLQDEVGNLKPKKRR